VHQQQQQQVHMSETPANTLLESIVQQFTCTTCTKDTKDIVVPKSNKGAGAKSAMTDGGPFDEMGGPEAEEVVSKMEPMVGKNASGVKMVFALPDGITRELVFSDKVLGMEFVRREPQKVKRVLEGSAAEKAGVRGGWVLMKIDGEDMCDKDVDYVLMKVRGQPVPAVTQPVPAVAQPVPGSFSITFQLPSGDEHPGAGSGDSRSVDFTKAPLGLEFYSSAPVAIKRCTPAGHAQSLGVQHGWIITHIAGEDVRKSDEKTICSKLREKAAALSNQAVPMIRASSCP